MAKPLKRSLSARKRKGKVSIKTSAEVRPKSKESAKNDTIQSPTPLPHTNAAVFKVKIKKK